MKLFKSLKICFTVVLLSSPLFSLAQYKFPIRSFSSYLKDASRWEIGGTGVLGWGTFNGTTRITGYNNQFIADSTLKRGVKSNFGFGAVVGIAVPIAATGHISVWALSMNAMVNMTSWSALNQTKSLDGAYTTPSPNEVKASTLQIALPVGIDWKIGADAINSKRLYFGMALGGGVMPHVNVTTLDPSAADGATITQQSIGFNPYVKAEASMFPGMLIKVRVLYTMGNVELMNTKRDIPGYNDGPFKLTNNSNLMFSLIFQPFSVRWNERSWHNTYDTYNWNEHLN
ncbi:hypothetical protein CJD36_013250 [Flavipsychrobacter stenotrophus]|uniref:Outer membrane protein beta-barrel domain-containing protein n=1 Tax=Flavipsychrobacter stenotrophus TaxID=2077091 RepID=A0A2S7SWE0_9BACT|nr:hypothetical protein [Flavipsychrobacter stenotrophus]PQJ10931.1 hypothetical protein CJD36_013250 [Flavipsychrobacter stenotrophus]